MIELSRLLRAAANVPASNKELVTPLMAEKTTANDVFDFQFDSMIEMTDSIL
jgi:hypothetical protein